MTGRIPEEAIAALACPQCGRAISVHLKRAECETCHIFYEFDENGALDLRLRQPKTAVCEFHLGTPLVPSGFDFGPLATNPCPEIELARVRVPWHISPQLLSYLPRAKLPTSLALDLGCGSGLHRPICEHAGFRWVGLDYSNAAAPIRGDGHALPFRDESFELVFSIAVLEHIRFPYVMAGEVRRVLKPGGLYIGTVAFLEPFHGDSYYHHTHLGTFNTLSTTGFSVLKVAPSASWSGLRAQVSMGGLFPRLPEVLGRSIVWPIELLHSLWWKAGRLVSSNADEVTRLVTNTGAFEFIARKPF